MSERTSYAPGTPSWVDLGTPDPAAASEFYSAIFGWEILEGPPEAGNYRMCMLRGKPVAGIGQQQDASMPPWWTTYVSVHSADETAAAIVADGGTILVQPMDVLDVGRMAVAADPAGAMFSIWEPRSHVGAALVNEPGTFCWNELATRHPVEHVAFYGAVFDWEAVRSAGPMEYVEFTLHGESIAGLMAMGDDYPPEMRDSWGIYFAVADCDDTAAKIAELGGTVIVPPTDIPPGRFAMCIDPQGAAFSILHLTEEL